VANQNYWMMRCFFLIPLIRNDIGMRRKVGSYVMLCLYMVSVHQINKSVADEQYEGIKKNKAQKC